MNDSQLSDQSVEEKSSAKVYKIKYTINALPGLVKNNYDGSDSFLDILAETEEDEVLS